MKQTTQISYTDGNEQIIEFPVSKLRNLKVDGSSIMDVHDLAVKIQKQTNSLRKMAFIFGLVGLLVLATNLYLMRGYAEGGSTVNGATEQTKVGYNNKEILDWQRKHEQGWRQIAKGGD